ncbi:hypothetical protein [Streptomyces sp. CPS1]
MNQTDPTTASVREQLLDALDFSYCQGLGYAEPAELLAAYDRERVAVVSPPLSRAALRDRIRRALCEADGFGFAWDTDMLEPDEYGEVADAVLAVLPEQADRAAVLPGQQAAIEAAAYKTAANYVRGHSADERYGRASISTALCMVADELYRWAAEAHDTGTQQPEAHANGLPLVKGNCPACRRASLFLGTGGYPTCSNYECPEPDAATTVLEQYANEAHAPSHVWTIESPRRDNWASWGTTYDDRDWAAERYESALSTAPQRPFRLVRATTTYTVEAERQPPTPVAQQPKAVPPGCWYNAEKAEEAMRDEPLDEPGPAAQQPAPCGDPQHRHIGPCHVYASPASGGAEQQPAPDDEEHVCKPGAQLYYCPTAGEVESDCHGGFDVCCGRPDLHQPIVAYRNSDRPGVLLCRQHGEGWVGLTPLTSEDLPEGGICTWNECGADVLAEPERP